MAMFVIVEHVFDPAKAADELAGREDYKRAVDVRTRGKGTFVVRGLDRLGSDRTTAEVALAKHAYDFGVYGLRYHLRLDFDPDWRIQQFAIREALCEVPGLRERSAVKAVNAFTRAYYGRDGRWDITDHGDGRWPQTDARNFADHAYLVANALGGLRLIDGTATPPYQLDVVARVGWSEDELRGDADLSAEKWLAIALGRTLRRCGEGDLDRLCQAFEAGGEGNS